MKQVPCEHILWKALPAIRKEIAARLIEDFGLNQKETAEKLGITPAAVCQYLSKKRGHFEITNKTIQTEIKISAERIIKEETAIIPETCRICQLLRQRKEFANIIINE